MHEGWELEDVHETADGVVAISKDGRKIEAAFLCGCDGLHSATRKIVLRRHGMPELPADFTGLVMVSLLVEKFVQLTI